MAFSIKRIKLPRFARPSRTRFWAAYPAIGLSVVLAALATQPVCADWPTHRGDLRRSGVTTEQLDASRLKSSWTWHATSPVRSAWPAPAKWDAYASLAGMKSMRNYDPVLHLSAIKDDLGEAIFLAGVTDDTVRRLDATTGEEVWRFTANGPVRVAPTWHQGLVFFGSDDGCAYALDAHTGEEHWRTQIVPDARWILNNGRFVSPWPVRTGVHVYDGTAYCAASFLPWESTYICALDAQTGQPDGAGRYIRDLGSGWTMEGPLLLSNQSIVVPQGRVPPLLINRADGTPTGSLEGGGGSFVLLTDDNEVLHGPGNKGGWITDSDGESRERIATYQKGNAVIIDGGVAWLLADATLTGLDRSTRTLLFSTKTDTPHALIKAGNILYAGGEDRVAAYDSETGQILWQAPVKGNAFGLAVAHGKLLVSTDEGVIHAFDEGASQSPFAIDATQARGSERQSRPELPALTDANLIDRWIFRQDLVARLPLVEGEPRRYPVIANERTNRPNGRFRQMNDFGETPIGEFLELDGSSNDITVTNPGEEVTLPSEQLTAIAVARIDEPRQWGGLVNALQDNGVNESGWILGYRGMKPGFGLRGSEGDTRYSWTTAERDLEPGTWHVLAATYDGATTILYVDGVEVARSAQEQGSIVYPERYWYALGSYHDDDEYFVTKGSLAEVRLYDRALAASELEELNATWQPLLDIPAQTSVPAVVQPTAEPLTGPIFAFDSPHSATIRWETARPIASELLVTRNDEVVFEFSGTEPMQQHQVRVPGLRANRNYTVELAVAPNGISEPSRPYMLDTSFNYTQPLMDTDIEPHAYAERLLSETGISDGLAVVLGADDPALALGLAQLSDLRVVVLDEDANAVADCRDFLLTHGNYGARTSVHVVEELNTAPLPPHCVNLLVGTPGHQMDTEKARALLVPESGRGFVNNRKLRTPQSPGTGTWTHMYGSPNNTGYGGESLGGVQNNNRLALQWIGRPGPRYQSDRGNRKPAPLAVSGRLYMQGLERIIALDANNGTVLWSMELPEVRRFNMPRDTSNWCADDNNIYLAGDRLLVIDGATGEIVRSQNVPSPVGQEADAYEWGYVARSGKHLIGSAQRKGNTHTGWWGSEYWYDGKDNFSVLKVCSDSLFASDPTSNSVRWRYEPNALIINSTITASDGTIVFLEAGDASLFDAESRQIEDVRLWKDLEMVALDQETGEVLWRRKANPMPGRIAVYTAAANGVLYLQTSDDGAFALYAFDLSTGASLWRQKFNWETDHHGKHLSRIAVAKDLLYLRPYVLDAQTGEVLRTEFPAGHQCGNYACTTDSIILRAGDLTMWAPKQNEVSRWTRVRPDCWISSVPANGMLLSPEGGGGCSCGSWIEASMGFRPVVKGPSGQALRFEGAR